MILDIFEVEIVIITEFLEIGKLQYTRIYGKLKRRNKLWSSNKLDDNYIDDEADNDYLCGGNNDCREIFIYCLIFLGDVNQHVNQPFQSKNNSYHKRK